MDGGRVGLGFCLRHTWLFLCRPFATVRVADGVQKASDCLTLFYAKPNSFLCLCAQVWIK